MNGELAKVIIRGYAEPEESAQQGNPVAQFQAMFNPESFAVNTDIQFDDGQADGETGSEFKFKSIAPREFSFEFVIDATGASGEAKDIEEEIEAFKTTVGFQENSGFAGNERRTLYLSISWGSFQIRCILKSMGFTYNLFRPDGSPIRATISAVFKEYKTPLQKVRENPESVLNLTRVKNLVSASDSLTGLAQELYGDGRKYIDIARANGLNSLKELTSGSRLEFPPLDQATKQLAGQIASASNAEKLVQDTIKLARGQVSGSAKSIAQLAAEAAGKAQTAISAAERRARTERSRLEQSGAGELREIATQSRTIESTARESYNRIENFINF